MMPQFETMGRDDRPLVGFLYDLIREELDYGRIEDLVFRNENNGDSRLCYFTDLKTLRGAQELAWRLGVRDAEEQT